MMKTCVISMLGALAVAGGVLGQEVKPPALLAKGEDGKSVPLGVDAVDVAVSVVGNVAETVMTIRFRNETDRVLEGELVFPLGEGRTVSRYALEVNGKMREGVAIPKNRGRQVFESIVRKEIDPGLLEWTKGNNFRTRIYPIPAKGFKSVRVGYEEELREEGGKYVYRLPLGFGEKVGEFKMRVDVERAAMEQDDWEVEGLELQPKKARTVVMMAEKKDFAADQPVVLRMKPEEAAAVAVEEKDGQDYFYIVDRPVVPDGAGGRAKPGTVRLIWDASNSGSGRDVEKELAFLTEFFAWTPDCTVRLEYLRHDLQAAGEFEVKDGKWGPLRKELEGVRYDGGTRLGVVNLKQGSEEAVVLVSDGIATLGKAGLMAGKRPVIALHASQSAEHGLLRSVARKSGGVYLNLAESPVSEAMKRVRGEQYALLGVEVEGQGKVSEVYPSGNHVVQGPVGVAGVLKGKKQVILKLSYGRNGQVAEVRKVIVDPKLHRSESGRVARMWAQKKLVELEVDAERERRAITKLAKAHGLVTRFTSLIVLDRIEDYVEHRITPPEPELRKEYERLLKQAPELDRGNQKHLKEMLVLWKARCEWHGKGFPGVEEIVRRRFQETDEIFDEVVKAMKKMREKDLDAEGKKQLATIRKALETYQGLKGEMKGLRKVEKEDQGPAWEREWGELGGKLGALLSEVGWGNEEDEQTLYSAVGASFGGATREGAPAAEAPANGGVFPVTPATPVVPDENGAEPPELPNVVGVDELFDAKVEGEDGRGDVGIALAKWDPKTPYLKALKKAKGDGALEAEYFRWKEKNANSSAFFLDVADFLIAKKREDLALRVLTNVAEMDLENVPLLRILGHRLDQLGELAMAEEVFREVKDLRGEEPQSLRDLALVLEKREQYQEALDLMWSVVAFEWDDRFPEIQMIALMELNALVARHGESLDLSAVDERFLKNLDCDVRIILTWDADNTDIDLWVTGPGGEKCYYSHAATASGGRMSNDFTGGYGPEEFLIRRGLPGSYRVQANYYGSQQQVLAGATTIQAVLVTNWGRPNEKREAVTLRLKDQKEVVDVGVLDFGKVK